MQGPAGVRTDYPPLEDENNGMENLEPGTAERPDGIVGPDGVACTVLDRNVVPRGKKAHSIVWLCRSSSRHNAAATLGNRITSAETHVAVNN